MTSLCLWTRKNRPDFTADLDLDLDPEICFHFFNFAEQKFRLRHAMLFIVRWILCHKSN